MTMTRMLGQLEAELREVSGPVALVGSSLGGTLAILAAARVATRIGRPVAARRFTRYRPMKPEPPKTVINPSDMSPPRGILATRPRLLYGRLAATHART